MDKAIETPVEGKRELALFVMSGATIPDDVKEVLQRLALEEPSPVTTIIEATELIYARADVLPPELLELAAQMAAVAANYNFHGMHNDDRGYGIAKELRKRPGVTPLATKPSSLPTPVPLAKHQPPADAPEEEPA